MGWSLGEDEAGRAIGYSVEATCDKPGCPTVIHRGLSHACGDYHGEGEDACSGYFCSAHLYDHDCKKAVSDEDD